MSAAITNIYSSLKNLLRTKQVVSQMQSPDLFIVDFADVLREYSAYREMTYLYNLFPLQDIVQTILSVSAYGDDGEYFWNELENRIMSDLTSSHATGEMQLDFDKLSFFYELLCCFLDEYIRAKLPENVDTNEYVFARWLGNTSILFQKDSNAMSSHGAM